MQNQEILLPTLMVSLFFEADLWYEKPLFWFLKVYFKTLSMFLPQQEALVLSLHSSIETCLIFH